jgi:hypothetical protein
MTSLQQHAERIARITTLPLYLQPSSSPEKIAANLARIEKARAKQERDAAKAMRKKQLDERARKVNRIVFINTLHKNRASRARYASGVAAMIDRRKKQLEADLRRERYLMGADARRSASRVRYEQQRVATPVWADRDAIRAVYRKAKRLTKQTGIKHHVDHIVPLQNDKVCGLHYAVNLRVIPAIDNLKKSNKF